MKEKYFYSEGYVYKGKDTICKLYGTEEEQQIMGEMIMHSLNAMTGIFELKENLIKEGFKPTKSD